MKTYRLPMDRTSWIATLLLLAAGIVFIYPFVWMFFSAFKDNKEIFHPMQLLPSAWSPQYYKQLFSNEWIPFWRVFRNSLVIATVQSIGTVLLTSLAGYVFAQHRFRFQSLLFVASLAIIVLPQQALAIPLFSWLNDLKLVDSMWGVVLPGIVSGLGILYFTQVFRQMPRELVEAARLAGLSEFRVYWTLLPLCWSALLSFGLIQFILSWHEHLIPLLVLSSQDKQTVPIALASLYGSSLRFPFAVLMAASVITVLPTAILFAVMYRRFKTSLSEVLPH
jgi:ABC-type glycerol-3-phosphate transport system permease component